MGNIKMSDVFNINNIDNYENRLCDVGYDDVGTLNTEKEAKYAAIAINAYDKNQELIKAQKEKLESVWEYATNIPLHLPDESSHGKEHVLHFVEHILELTNPRELSDIEKHAQHVLNQPIDYLTLSTRIKNCLKAEGIINVRDLVTWTNIDLLKTPNLGKKSVSEIKQVLETHHLHLKFSQYDGFGNRTYISCTKKYME